MLHLNKSFSEMKYPTLENTPIKEIVFSISFDDDFDVSHAEKFIESNEIKNRFKEINDMFGQTVKFDKEGMPTVLPSDQIGFDLKNKQEVLRIRNGRFSYHFLNQYKKFQEILDDFISFWEIFKTNPKEQISIINCSVRYINLIEIDENDQASRLVQLYPKYSSDRIIKGFQNAVKFQYKENPECEINAVTSKLDNKNILLDITVSNTAPNQNSNNIKIDIEPLQELKNKAFFDSITAKALLKYLKIER